MIKFQKEDQEFQDKLKEVSVAHKARLEKIGLS